MITYEGLLGIYEWEEGIIWSQVVLGLATAFVSDFLKMQPSSLLGLGLTVLASLASASKQIVCCPTWI
jgi:hypothetical protein